MTGHMMETKFADAMARRSAMFTRVADGYLVFYSGNESESGSWIETGRTMIDDDDGVTRVSRHAVERICNQPGGPK